MAIASISSLGACIVGVGVCSLPCLGPGPGWNRNAFNAFSQLLQSLPPCHPLKLLMSNFIHPSISPGLALRFSPQLSQMWSKSIRNSKCDPNVKLVCVRSFKANKHLRDFYTLSYFVFMQISWASSNTVHYHKYFICLLWPTTATIETSLRRRCGLYSSAFHASSLPKSFVLPDHTSSCHEQLYNI